MLGLRWGFVAAVLLTSLSAPVRADYYVTQIDFVTGNSSVLRLSEATGQPVPGFNFVNPSSAIVAPSSITVGPDGFLYVADSFTGVIAQVNAVTGNASLFASLPPIAVEPEFIPNAAGGIRFNSAGNLVVASRGDDNIYEIDYTTRAPSVIATFSSGTTPSGINFNSQGNLLVTGFASGSVYEIVAGVPQEVVAPPSPPNTPIGVLPTGDGRLWVTDVFQNTLRLFSSTGIELRSPIVVPPTIPDELPQGATAPTNSPAEMSFDSEGNILLATLGLQPFAGYPGAIFRIERPAGDYNGDMQVNSADYQVWEDNFGQAAEAGYYDGNGDGVYNAADYTVWRDSLGQAAEFVTVRSQQGDAFSSVLQYTPILVADVAAVPEPTTLALAVISLLGLQAVRRRV